MSLQPSVPAASPEQSVPVATNGPVLHAAPGGSPNGSPLARASHLPRARQGKKVARFLIPAAVLLVVVGIVLYFLLRDTSAGTNQDKAPVVKKELIQFKIVERGTLEAKDNHNIVCEVKTGSRGAPKIKDVVENGTLVKKGDLLVVIDDSYLQEQMTNQKIIRDKAEAEKTAAELLYPSKLTAIDLAKQNKEKWVKGDFPQQLHDLEGQIQTSESNLLQEEDRTAWVARMVKKKYMTASQEEAEQALLMGNKLDLQKKQEQKKVLTDYTNPTTLQDLDNKILIAVNDEKSTKQDMLIKQAIFKQQDDLYEDLKKQIEQCKVKASHSGIVVYSLPEQTRMGSGSNQSIIAQGEPVQYGQKMMSIPDLTHMVVNVRIHEAFIGHMEVKARVEELFEGGAAEKAGLKSGDVITQVGDKPIKFYQDLAEATRGHKPGQTMKVRLLRDRKESEVEITFGDHTPPEGTARNPRASASDPGRLFGVKFQVGLPAEIRVEAAPGKVLKGHVTSVASVAAQQDWMSPDVKVYQAYVEIDDSVKELKLKPGLSAVCTIFTESQAENVLAVPVQTILPASQVGGNPRVLVATPKGHVSREIKLLKVDDKLMTDGVFVAVEEGLREGEEVLLSPKTALGDKDKKSAKDGDKPGQPDRPEGGKGKGKAGAPGNGASGYPK